MYSNYLETEDKEKLFKISLEILIQKSYNINVSWEKIHLKDLKKNS